MGSRTPLPRPRAPHREGLFVLLRVRAHVHVVGALDQEIRRRCRRRSSFDEGARLKIWELQRQDQSTRCHPLDRSPRWTHTSRCLALALREALARASDPAARGHPSRQIAHGCSHEKNVRHHWMPMEKAACLALLVASATIDHGGQRLHVLFERERISSAGTACGSSCDGISGRRKRTPPRLLLGRR